VSELRPPAAVVRSVLGEPAAVVGESEAVALLGGFSALAGTSSIYLVRGRARVGAEEREWRVVLKALVPVPGADDPSHIRYWRREPLLYGSGALDDLAGPLRAPRCHGLEERPDGSVWL